MIKDPDLMWNGPFPYDVLAVAGVTPRSSMREVKDASFALMDQGGMTPEARTAWDELRTTQRRLVVDFFLYPAELPSGFGAETGSDTFSSPAASLKTPVS